MKNSVFFLLYLSINLIVLSITLNEKKNRLPSSFNSESLLSCMKEIKKFFKKPVIDESLYLEHLKKYQSSNQLEKEVFESIEDYSAWLDWRVSKAEFSIAKYYLTPGMMGEFRKTKLSLSRPDKITRFFFGVVLDSVIKKSIKIEGLDSYRYILLKSFLSRKIANEALQEFGRNNSKPGLWSRVGNSKYTKAISNLISYAPIAFGFPPLKIPSFMLKEEKQLLAAKSTEEALKIYKELSVYKKSSLAFKMSYNHFKKYYTLGVASYYFYFTYLDFEMVSNQEEMLNEIGDGLDQSTKELVELIAPSCQSVINCLEEYRLEWDNEDDNLYYDYKNTCRDIYNVTQDC